MKKYHATDENSDYQKLMKSIISTKLKYEGKTEKDIEDEISNYINAWGLVNDGKFFLGDISSIIIKLVESGILWACFEIAQINISDRYFRVGTDLDRIAQLARNIENSNELIRHNEELQNTLLIEQRELSDQIHILENADPSKKDELEDALKNLKEQLEVASKTKEQAGKNLTDIKTKILNDEEQASKLIKAKQKEIKNLKDTINKLDGEINSFNEDTRNQIKWFDDAFNNLAMSFDTTEAYRSIWLSETVDLKVTSSFFPSTIKLSKTDLFINYLDRFADYWINNPISEEWEYLFDYSDDYELYQHVGWNEIFGHNTPEEGQIYSPKSFKEELIKYRNLPRAKKYDVATRFYDMADATDAESGEFMMQSQDYLIERITDPVHSLPEEGRVIYTNDYNITLTRDTMKQARGYSQKQIDRIAKQIEDNRKDRDAYKKEREQELSELTKEHDAKVKPLKEELQTKQQEFEDLKNEWTSTLDNDMKQYEVASKEWEDASGVEEILSDTKDSVENELEIIKDETPESIAQKIADGRERLANIETRTHEIQENIANERSQCQTAEQERIRVEEDANKISDGLEKCEALVKILGGIMLVFMVADILTSWIDVMNESALPNFSWNN